MKHKLAYKVLVPGVMLTVIFTLLWHRDKKDLEQWGGGKNSGRKKKIEKKQSIWWCVYIWLL